MASSKPFCRIILIYLHSYELRYVNRNSFEQAHLWYRDVVIFGVDKNFLLFKTYKMQKLYWNQSSGRRHSKIFFPKGSRAEGRFEVLTIVFVFSRRYSSVTSVLVRRIFWKMLTWKGAKYYENKKQKQNKQQIPSVRNTKQAINNL